MRPSTLLFLLMIGSAQAEHLGTHGRVFQISEPDMIAVIKARIQAKIDSGEFDRLKAKAQEEARESILNPATTADTPLTATESRVYWHDPTIRVSEAIKAPDGQVIVPAGTVINPLDYAPFTSKWIFIDGRDKKQTDWAKTQLTDESVRPIFVAGKWMDFWKEWQHRTFFDMKNVLVKKLGIRNVPAVVTQDDDLRRIRIEEIALH